MREIKDAIDSVEEKNQNEAKLKKKIEFLKSTINRLKFTIKEQKKLVKELKESESAKEDIPNDIKILKDLVSTQREDLKDKDDTISRLESNLNQVKSELAKKEEILENTVEKERFLGLKDRIRSLVKEKKELKNRINSLQSKLKKFEDDKSQEEITRKLGEAKQKITDLKRERESSNSQIEHLQQKVDKLRNSQTTQSELNQKITDLKSEIREKEEEKKGLANKVNHLQEKLTQAQEKIKRLKQEKEDLVGKVSYFQEELEKLESKKLERLDKTDLMEDIYSQFTKEKGFVNEKVSNYEEKILELKELLEKKDSKIETLRKKLQEGETPRGVDQTLIEESVNQSESGKIQKDKTDKVITIDQKAGSEKVGLNVKDIPQFYQKGLIEYMFNVMSENRKQNVIDFLIQNLDNENPQVRRFTIKILSTVKTNKVFNALIDRISDDDWLVRYYMVKALKSFPEFDGVKKVLEEYLNDPDVDVREAAKEALQELQ